MSLQYPTMSHDALGCDARDSGQMCMHLTRRPRNIQSHCARPVGRTRAQGFDRTEVMRVSSHATVMAWMRLKCLMHPESGSLGPSMRRQRGETSALECETTLR